ncbi:hypothetical protein UACE39S_03343 [Ureibacillus acetophenoni]
MLTYNKFTMIKYSFQDFSSIVVLVAGLAFLGVHLGVDLYLAAIFAFGVCLFQNIAVIRRILIQKWDERHLKKSEKTVE